MGQPKIALFGDKFPCLREVHATPEIFPGYEIRQSVGEIQKPWNSVFREYNPPNYTSPRILQKTAERNNVPLDQAADPLYVEPAEIAKRLSLTGPLHFAKYLDPDGETREYPLNPIGRTGIRGRGACKNWGPIQSADAFLTRFNPDKGLLELLVIKRVDNGAWAFPGGKVDRGETHHIAALRELFEEAVSFDTDQTDSHSPLPNGRKPPFYFFTNEVVFEGVHADPRNTDNAWYEGRVFHKHLDWNLSENLKLHPSSDASDVKWLQLTPENISTLFADHSEITRFALAKMELESQAKIKPLTEEILQAIKVALSDQYSTETFSRATTISIDQAAQ